MTSIQQLVMSVLSLLLSILGQTSVGVLHLKVLTLPGAAGSILPRYVFLAL
jgi:hypothetical protein